MSDTKALIVALSGCSSSGKTTLARILRDIFPSTFILHEDDFYRPEAELPSKDGLLDWDCAGALDIDFMVKCLTYIRENASFPPDLDSKEDQNSIGKCPVPQTQIDALKQKVADALPADNKLVTSKLRLCLFDGFLLFSPSMKAIHSALDIKVFLRASYTHAKARREARDGYATIEGFWADPPGYVDKVVWPNYVLEHAWMFENGDVEGKFKQDIMAKESINVVPGEPLDGDMCETLEWLVDLLLEQVQTK